MATRPVRVFVSYAHEDERLWQKLKQHLSPLVREHLIEIKMWSDRSLSLGSEWPKVIEEALENADLFLLLISANYFASDAASAEMAGALKRVHAGQARLVPILLRPAEISGSPVADFQVLPVKSGELLPVELWKNRDQAFASITKEIRTVVERWPEQVSATEPAPAGTDTRPRISPSVRNAIRGTTDVSAATLAMRLLEMHPEYGGGTGRSVSQEEVPSALRRSAREWLQEVRSLYREDVVPELHGRVVICGLALLDRDLTRELLERDFLSKLEAELEPPLHEILTPLAHRLRTDVPAHADRPARIDRLRRDRFAEELAEMIDEEREHSAVDSGRPESFLVHLHGPWGSGKTSLLGFLGGKLQERPSQWVVVTFNAWQHERLGTPWWSLMTAVHRAGKRAPFPEGWWRSHAWWHGIDRERWRDLWRSTRLLWFDVVWRVRLAWMAYIFLPIFVALLWLGWRNGFFDAATTDQGWLTQAGNIAKPVGAILGLVVALLGAARGLSRSLAIGSARGAETFIRTTRDPMRTLRRRFERLVTTIDRPLAVFVDDLDRCQSKYVVEVLQGIQTLLIEAPVTYVVAADRRWLYDSYLTVYADFTSVAREPGRPLGHLFLEKTFQLSASVPRPAPDVRDEFWRQLVLGEGVTPASDDTQLREEAEERVATADLGEALEVVDASRHLSPSEERAAREAVSSRLGDPDLQHQVAHMLLPFASLLEPNPRAMKRLINAYRIELRRLLAEGKRFGSTAWTPEQLALWTILQLRWPLLADHYARRPDLLAGAELDETSKELHPLWASDDVQAVIAGDGVPAELTEPTLRMFVGVEPRRAADRSNAARTSAADSQNAVA